MPKADNRDLSLFLDILNTLESLDIPYMIIGAFAGAVYGVTRMTYDIDIVVVHPSPFSLLMLILIKCESP